MGCRDPGDPASDNGYAHFAPSPSTGLGGTSRLHARPDFASSFAPGQPGSGTRQGICRATKGMIAPGRQIGRLRLAARRPASSSGSAAWDSGPYVRAGSCTQRRECPVRMAADRFHITFTSVYTPLQAVFLIPRDERVTGPRSRSPGRLNVYSDQMRIVEAAGGTGRAWASAGNATAVVCKRIVQGRTATQQPPRGRAGTRQNGKGLGRG